MTVNSLNYLGAYVYISNDQKELNKSDILILVAFPKGMKYNLDDKRKSGLSINWYLPWYANVV